MDVLEAIRTRRSIGAVSDEQPPRKLIEKILEAATHAPNHHNVEPWHFFVLTGDERRRLGEVDAEITEESLPEHLTDAQRAAVLDAQRAKSLRAPVIVVATVARPASEKVIYIENVAAVGAAVQNMLLAAHAEGLGAKWRTGSIAYRDAAKRLFGLAADQHILGLIYIGYPMEQPDPSPRVPLAERVTWRGPWDT